MDIQHLRCFVTVAEELHFGRASERLHLTPSPVSRKVKELERELGVTLFERRYHSVTLTPAGEALLPDARALLTDFSRLKRAALEFDDSTSTYVCRIGFAHVAPPALLDSLIELVGGIDRPVEVAVTAGITSELLPALEEGDLDLAILHTPIDSAELELLPIAQYSHVVAMRAGHPLAGRESLTLDDLVGNTMITHPLRNQPRSWRVMRQITDAIGLTDVHEVMSTDPAHTASYIRYSDEIVLTPTFATAVYDRDPAFQTVPLHDDRIRWGAVVAWRRDMPEIDSALESIVALLAEAFREGPAAY